jgi:hypothetical protein
LTPTPIPGYRGIVIDRPFFKNIIIKTFDLLLISPLIYNTNTP